MVLANLASSLNPSKIVIGGGVSKAGEILRSKVEQSFKRFVFPRAGEAAEIVIASLGNDAGVIGGAWIAKPMAEKPGAACFIKHFRTALQHC